MCCMPLKHACTVKVLNHTKSFVLKISQFIKPRNEIIEMHMTKKKVMCYMYPEKML